MHKILIIDDEQDILQAVKELIEDKFHCEVDTATNGLDAFLKVKEQKFDLILTDQNMPFMKGSAFIIATRTKENQNQLTPIIMLSGYIDNQIREKLKVQSVEFLEKPFMPMDLISLIRDNLI